MMSEDLRTITMFDWLENDLLLSVIHCDPASSDASFRRYFRIHASGDDISLGAAGFQPDRPKLFPTQKQETRPEKSGKQNFIVMDAPPEKENIEPFIRVARLLAESQINVPTIFRENLTEGFLLLEDFGSQCLLDRLNTSSANDLYQSALDSLFKLQTRITPENRGLPYYDEAFLHRELAIFHEWFLSGLLDIPIPADLWTTVTSLLINSALEQPKTFVHRDYHSRNLMVLEIDSPGIIDFQDAVVGPITYDLVSLLRDCYIAWPEQQVDQWRHNYFQRLKSASLIDCSYELFIRWFDLMGLQRHLKAVGIFSRLHLRDGKSGYLSDIPRTLNYVTAVCSAYPELEAFNAFLTEQVLPALSAVEA